MRQHWDAIIVGAGIGALCAAGFLKKAGLKVLVLDKNPHPGGTAYTYVRKGFTFPMGPLGFSSPHLVRSILAELDCEMLSDFTRIHYQVMAFGIRAPLSRPFGHLTEALAAQFPEDGKGIEAFFETVRSLLPGTGPRDGRHASEVAISKTSARVHLASLVGDWRLRRILGSLGTHEAYSSMSLLAAMWNLMSEEGIWHPAGGMGRLCDILAQRVADQTEAGDGQGEIRLGTGVAEIKVHQVRATGVVLADGTELEAGGVISNADYKTTFLRLIHDESAATEWRAAIAAAKQTASNLQVCLGVNESRVDLSCFSGASRIIYRRWQEASAAPWQEVDWTAREVDPCVLGSQELEVSLITRESPDLAPPGGATIVIRTAAEHAHFAKYRAPQDKRAPEYGAYKRRLADALHREVSHLIPGLEEAIIVMDVATPLTFEDQGGRSEGAVAGWSWDHQDCPDQEPRALTQTPVKGLYMAGHQAYSTLFLGGVPTAMASGKDAAEALLQRLGPTEEPHFAKARRGS